MTLLGRSEPTRPSIGGATDWIALQNELAALSTNSSHHVVDGATHTSVVDDPGHARVTSAAIVEVVDAARNNRPLAR